MVEPALAALPPSRVQFERVGYFCADRVDHVPGRPVFNRTVSLKGHLGQDCRKRIRMAPGAANDRVTMITYDFSGQTAVVTGGTRGIRGGHFRRAAAGGGDGGGDLCRRHREAAEAVFVRSQEEHRNACAPSVSMSATMMPPPIFQGVRRLVSAAGHSGEQQHRGRRGADDACRGVVARS